MQKLNLKALLILLLATILTSCNTEEQPELVAVEDVYGIFFVYVPTSISPKPSLLVLIHGTPAETWSVEETAKYYIYHWIDFAEQEGVALIAPSFFIRISVVERVKLKIR